MRARPRSRRDRWYSSRPALCAGASSGKLEWVFAVVRAAEAVRHPVRGSSLSSSVVRAPTAHEALTTLTRSPLFNEAGRQDQARAKGRADGASDCSGCVQ